ncbi:DUF2911 domain-containing protein [Maribacter sp. ANRC-HE7]|uniref:DUF2911 domain-containing protein n=1 Tax=Maribacter aquimaris TaxID=2737171 RepID=A0ABR7UWI2_9FLAO|nr:DUF2911 domain-containing protein [Maribacter aquimaris]MBD0776879.1 DUF2911 domain-containing protein [Maribacter aquimaris]
MKNSIILLCLILLVSCKETSKEAQVPQHQDATEQKTISAEPAKKKPLSPHTSAMAMVGDAHIHFDYSSPGVRNRIVFGGLLPYDAVWQAGAHMATWMETNKDLTIDGKVLKAGKYGFFVIPNQKEWTIIFNTNWNQHGKDEYDKKDDVLRFKVIPKISEEIQEHLEYKITKVTDTSGAISLSWEKAIVGFPFDVK